ncbi:putative ribosomal large subunit pseudouridine synthase protein [Parvularcula bermudensis HTCC2503]|uniref:Pseudouridine synthase n=1 Tax=Parvularcula bermudensis (strain ATCC BAA-594 / HTCC2503 / KCTC 12087) TaxID=314260 RepID=E0TDJ8_PARBH|nr:RluA family pseudouridine synthase [Parvularcula bermudensis]ADM08753.1 putative ribosomal large subunit pseudouridine synthase protein [Parvularcula bermudensis HTCC2503]
MSDTEPLSFTVAEADVGARLDKWIADQTDAYSRARIKALIEGGALTKDAAPFTDPKWKLRQGEVFTLVPPPPEDPTPKPEDIPLTVLFEDGDLIVINKPAGLVVHPAAGNWTGTLVNALLHHCGDTLSGIGGVIRPGIVHRLDKDTSGVMVIAKNDHAHQGLSALFAAHDIDRAYLALCEGSPRPTSGTITWPLARSSGDRKKMTVVGVDRPEGKEAITHFARLDAYGIGRAKLPGDALASLVECRLETGRTHQIRVHMSHIGHPLLGDPVYGRSGLAGLKPGDPAADHALGLLRRFRRQALHAVELGFDHPVTGEALHFRQPPPHDFSTLVEAFKVL